eukprot:m51a1_g5092 hypothetical protein (135) ;mRNA; f:268637-269202
MAELDDKTIELVSQLVELVHYEDCRDFLQQHPQLISQAVSDSLFEKGYMIWDTHPREIAERFIRDAQMLHYMVDLQRASNGQQDITLFFHRLLDDDPSFRDVFEGQVRSILEHVEQMWAKRRAAKAQKEKESKP